jgi:hypothetical protein
MSATFTVDRRRPDGPLTTHAHASIDWLRDTARDALADRGEGAAPPARDEATAAKSNGRHPAAPEPDFTAIYEDVQRHLERAESSLGERGITAWWSGSRTEGALYNYNAALSRAVLLWSDHQLRAALPRILCVIRRYLPKSDPERRAVDKRFPVSGRGRRQRADVLSPLDREALAGALRSANAVSAAEQARFRRFRNVLLGASIVVLLLIATLIGYSAANPGGLPLCFPDTSSASSVPADGGGAAAEVQVAVPVCPSGRYPVPTGGDVATVVMFGLVGAALTGVRTVARRAPPSSVPLGSVRVLQALFKASIGMLGAVLGLLFLRAGVVPGFTALDTQSEILVYAIVFGAAQDLFTRLIDSRANDLAQKADPDDAPAAAEPAPSTPVTADAAFS